LVYYQRHLTHFGHGNIIKYCDRPYKDVDEMNQELIKNWNSVVTDNDIVIHLGDVGFGTGGFIELMKQLNGYIILIKGNHDRKKQIAKMLDVGAINEYYSADMVGWEEDDKFLFSHKPTNPDKFMSDYTINIHGHIHNSKFNEFCDYTSLGRFVNVSLEVINYKPALLSDYVGIIS
jgi:calcineurin-like phosphoesterase family protein